MNKPLSFFACLVIALVLLQQRIAYLPQQREHLKVTTYDALGYYMYLPGIALYGDVKELKWFPKIDSTYQVSGGWFYQANKMENGNYVFKYLGGVALLQTPFLYIGHVIAKNTHYPADGFSPPYQYALAFGILIYCILALFLLRRILLLYFDDRSTAVGMLLLTLATNFVQYACVDNAMSHAYIFPLYVMQLWYTIKWHERARVGYAFAIGLVIGIATICRPTEAVMLFIPLLWGMQTKTDRQQKWAQVKANKTHVLYAVLGGLIGVLPQLLYWKSVTGSFVYDVGSKWDFASPHFRVLFGWEKGWFIYTPVTILFIIGMFYIRKFPFSRSVWWFCFLNIYIVIAWSDWRYGGSYSTRALVQSYPVFALPLTAFISHVQKKLSGRVVLLFGGMYLLFVNLFQLWQYNKNILHYNDMNRAYYSSIYLNANPTPLDMSLLDSNVLINESNYSSEVLYGSQEQKTLLADGGQPANITSLDVKGAHYIKIVASIKTTTSFYDGYLYAETDKGIVRKVRLHNAISKEGVFNTYTYYLPTETAQHVNLYLQSVGSVNAVVRSIQITAFKPRR